MRYGPSMVLGKYGMPRVQFANPSTYRCLDSAWGSRCVWPLLFLSHANGRTAAFGDFDVRARVHVLSAVVDPFSQFCRRRCRCFRSSVVLSFGEDFQIEVVGAWLVIARLRYPQIPRVYLCSNLTLLHCLNATDRRCDCGLRWGSGVFVCYRQKHDALKGKFAACWCA